MRLKYYSIQVLIVALFYCTLFNACNYSKAYTANSFVALTKTQILIKHVWQIDELWTNTSGTNVHYLRGVENTSEYNQDIVRLTFNEDGTGTHTDAYGTVYPTTWEFPKGNENNLTLTINGVTTDYWNLIDITEKHILESAARPSVLISARWVPVP